MLYTNAAWRTGTSEVNMGDGLRRDWREICEAVINESDPTRLSLLIPELMAALDKDERSWRHTIPSFDASASEQTCAPLIRARP